MCKYNNLAINQKFKWTNANTLQSLYINMGKMGRNYMTGNDSENGVSFKFMFKCRQYLMTSLLKFWRNTVAGFCRRTTKRSAADCSQTCLWYDKIRWRRRTQTLSTWKIGDRHALDCQSDARPFKTPKREYCQLERYSLWCTKPMQTVSWTMTLCVSYATRSVVRAKCNLGFGLWYLHRIWIYIHWHCINVLWISGRECCVVFKFVV